MMTQTSHTKQNVGIACLKALAVFLIANFHSGTVYPSCRFIATGGDIGNAMFFFLSGLTLFSSATSVKWGGAAWYRHRLSRILPSLVGWLLIAYCLATFGLSGDDPQKFTTFSAMTGRSYWFIKCILVYYILYWIVVRYFAKHLVTVFLLAVAALAARYLYFELIVGEHGVVPLLEVIRYWTGFPYMILGGIIAKSQKKTLEMKAHWLGMLTVVSCSLYLFIHWLAIHASNCHWLIVPFHLVLLWCCAVLYFFTQSERIDAFLHHRFIMLPMLAMSALTLEVYVCHFTFLTDRFNSLFPLNILGFWMLTLMVASGIKVLGRFVSLVLAADYKAEKPLSAVLFKIY